MSKNNESYKSNKESKSSKIIKISKDRKESASKGINYITLKGDNQEMTEKINNISINKKNIEQAISNIKSISKLSEKNLGLNEYLKRKNVMKFSSQRKTPKLKKSESINLETDRNLIRTTENIKNNLDNNNGYGKNLIKKKKNNDNGIFKEININNENDKDENKVDSNDIQEVNLIEEDNIKNYNEIDDNINKNYIDKKKLISKNYIININNNNQNKNENVEKYKSEEIKEINSDSSRIIGNILIKTNNFVDKNNQQSDKAAKSISELDGDNKTKIISKIKLEKTNSNNEDNNKEKSNSEGLITENEIDNKSIKDSEKGKIEILSDNKTSKSIKESENEDLKEEKKIEKKYYNNLIDDKSGDKNNKAKSNTLNNKNKEEEKIIEDKNDNNIKELVIKKKENKEKDKDKEDNDEDDEDADNEESKRKIRLIKNIQERRNNSTYQLCSLCEHSFPIHRLFVAECDKHYLCRRCAKNYYEDIIENGKREMTCPFIKCKKLVDLEGLRKLISKAHFECLCNNTKYIDENQNKIFLAKIKTKFDKENLQPYIKKNVLDINSNRNFYNYNNIKGVYCPNCYMEALFSKTSTHFFKCLNCNCKRCKYCLKEFNSGHMDVNLPNHCKVFHRYDDYNFKNNSIMFNYLIQLGFILASYYICFASTFIFIRDIFLFLFRANSTGNILLYILSYFFAIIFFIIVIPFIEIFYPFFPNIMATFDY